MMKRRDAEFTANLGDRARHLRERHGWTVNDLAAELYVTPRAVKAFESGEATPLGFLRRWSEVVGTSPQDLVWAAGATEFYSVFLSYGGPDEAIAGAIYRSLRRRKIRCFFFPHSARIGQRLHRTMSEGIAEYDRVVLLCSRPSLNRAGVQNELEQVLIREAAEGGTELVLPVALDDYLFAGWKPTRRDLAAQLRARVVADLRRVQPSTRRWQKEFRRLADALRKPTAP
jgi:transcriptional regulator with XRE-family HTH domain